MAARDQVNIRPLAAATDAVTTTAQGVAKPGASYAPAANTGDILPLAIDKDSGGLLTHTRRLDFSVDNVVVRGELDHDAVDTVLAVQKIGSKSAAWNAEPAVVTTGDRVAAAIDNYGRLRVLNTGNELVICYTNGTRSSAPALQSPVNNLYAKGAIIYIGVTSIVAAPSVTVTLEGVSPVTPLAYHTILERVITAAGTFTMKVHPGLTPVAGEVANDFLPRVWRVKLAHANSDAITYNVGLCYVM